MSRAVRSPALVAALGLAVLTLAMYGDILFSSGDTVISSEAGDTALYFSAFRDFAAGEIASGNLPLWNPHVFSGAPFMGGFQSALFYPPNATYLFLPLTFALNLDICLHTFLMGFFTWLWIRSRGLHPAAAFFAAAVLMFSGPYAMRVLAGQLTVLSTLAYVPLLLLAIDRIFDRAHENQSLLGSTLFGIVVTSLHVLAGYPQSLFMTAVVAAVYCGFRLIVARQRVRALPALAAIGIAPILITAVQLWTGLEVAQETIRAGGVSYDFATRYSFPLENLATLVTPSFFGDAMGVPYWGRWSHWDVSLFMGITALALALYGAIAGDPAARRFSGPMVLVFLLVAFGRYTPLYTLLYGYFPGFTLFRSPSKYLFYVALFSAMLAAAGLDRLLRQPEIARSFARPIAVFAGLFILAASVVALTGRGDPPTSWDSIIDSFTESPDVFIVTTSAKEALARSWIPAATSLVLAAATCALLALLFRFARRPALIYAIIGLGIIEVFVFARHHRATFEAVDPSRETVWPAYIDAGQQRVLDVARFEHRWRNHAAKERRYGVWGYDPVVLKRYGDFVTFAAGGLWHAEDLREHIYTWGSDPFGEAVNLEFNNFTPQGLQRGTRLLKLLRTRYIVQPHVPGEYAHILEFVDADNESRASAPTESGTDSFYEIPGAFPEAFLVQNYEVMSPDLDMLAAMTAGETGLRQTVFLESPPQPKPGPKPSHAAVRLLDRSTDHIDYAVDLSHPAILVITNAFSRGWRARPLEGSAQQTFTVVPANYALMAVPLEAGRHRFRLEYMPNGYRYGRWVSLLSALAFCAATTIWFTRSRREKRS